jgi:hypothetical protein
VSPCPAGFAKQHQAGTSATDGRTCASCTCTQTPCGGSVSIYSDTNCMTNGQRHVDTIAANATCGTLADTPFTAIRFKSTATGGCSASGFDASLKGSIAFADEQTICCP